MPSFRPLLAPVPRLRFRTDTQTDRQTHTQDNYRNPPAHARRGLIISNELYLIALLPNTQACLSLPIGTASVERSFSQMKLIKTRLCNRLEELSLSHLIKIAIESPETLSDSDLEEVVTIWNKKVEELQFK